MTILFDLFITDPEMEEELSVEEKIVFNTIKDFYTQRLIPLKEEIDKQENLNPENNSCVIIHLLPPQEQWHLPPEQQDQKIRTSMHGYSNDLMVKMDSCFTKEDFEYLNNYLENSIKSIRN